MKISSARLECFKSALDDLRYSKEWVVEITETSARRAEKKEFGINWCACGTVSPEKAREVRNQLDKMIKIADWLNEADLEVVYTSDNFIVTEDDYETLRNKLADMIAEKSIGDVLMFLGMYFER